MGALERECAASNMGALFQEAKNLLSGEREGGAYAGISQRLAMSEGAVRVAVHRLRQRYRALLREEIAQTLTDTAQVEEELRSLQAALAS